MAARRSLHNPLSEQCILLFAHSRQKSSKTFTFSSSFSNFAVGRTPIGEVKRVLSMALI
ncbi:MAG: hypothetical protein AVDCRST_MAG56-2733 [uncultured Cytophagales bacterium]|uniref:Uncharacterized protein n=1 Tax=uncultured Cytophagales bacterium TaxID=158755 RepID=A0A6J4J0Z3_9SPHI|nr:MAG: hypothetical protein AVDCRST_MAG56-2733 [uncultured Cytophagales bacterium]